jgi:hypothetical protein
MIGQKIAVQGMSVHTPSSDMESAKVCLDVTYQLIRHEDEIKNAIKRAIVTLPKKESRILESIWINPLTLASLFHIISPNWTRLRDFSFVETDFERLVRQLQPYSFRISIQNEVRETMSKIQEALLADLGRYDFTLTLTSAQQKKVAFYLLLLYLPDVVEECIEKNASRA